MSLVCLVIVIHAIRGEWDTPYSFLYFSLMAFYLTSIFFENQIMKLLQVLFMLATGAGMSVESNEGTYMGIAIIAVSYACYYHYGFLKHFPVAQSLIWAICGFSWFALTSTVLWQFDITRAISRTAICIVMVLIVHALAREDIIKARKLDELEKAKMAHAALVLVKKQEEVGGGSPSQR